MQLMWLSGPTGRIKTISITAATIIRVALGIGVFLVIMGFLLNLLGLRIAVEHSPELARSLGGVTTESEQLRMESVYRDKLDQMKNDLQGTMKEIKQLESIKNKFMEIAVPQGFKEKANPKCGLINIQNKDNECFRWCMKYHQAGKITHGESKSPGLEYRRPYINCLSLVIFQPYPIASRYVF